VLGPGTTLPIGPCRHGPGSSRIVPCSGPAQLARHYWPSICQSIVLWNTKKTTRVQSLRFFAFQSFRVLFSQIRLFRVLFSQIRPFQFYFKKWTLSSAPSLLAPSYNVSAPISLACTCKSRRQRGSDVAAPRRRPPCRRFFDFWMIAVILSMILLHT
jgi:hypothetical protein